MLPGSSGRGKPDALCSALAHNGPGVGWAEASHFETFFCELTDDSRVARVMQSADRNKIRSRRVLCAKLGDFRSHLGIPLINDSRHDLLVKGFILRILLVDFGGEPIQIACKIQIDQLS